MQRRVVLHIGAEKTGTTAIQRFLAANRDALEKQGFLYSRIMNGSNHMALAAFAVDADPAQDFHRHNRVTAQNQPAFRERLRQQLSKELDSGRTLILSNEHLSSKATEPEQIRRLTELFRDLDAQVEVVLYLRRLVPMMEASYSTFIKNRRTWPFNFRQEIDRRSRYDLRVLVDRWDDAFPGRVRVRLYREEFKQEPFALLTDFLATAGLAASDSLTMPDTRANPSISRSALELLRWVNLVHAAETSTYRGILRREFIREAEQGTAGPAFHLDAVQRAEVDHAYRASLESLRARVDDGIVDYLLLDDDATTAEYSPSATEEERVSALGALLRAAETATEQVATKRAAEQTADLQAMLAEAQKEIDRQQLAIDEAHDKLRDARAAAEELARVRATRTWRWTAPARSVIARLRPRR